MQTNTDHQDENLEQKQDPIQQAPVQQAQMAPPPTNIVYQNFQPQVAEKNNIGLTGFILSIVAIVISWIPIVGWLCWLLGLIFSIIGLFRKPKGLAIAGLIISLIGFIILILLISVLAGIMMTM